MNEIDVTVGDVREIVIVCEDLPTEGEPRKIKKYKLNQSLMKRLNKLQSFQLR